MGTPSIHVTHARLKGIYREAICLNNQGWLVLANHIPGYCPPPEIEGFIPDIYALKENRTFIMMVESQGDRDPLRTALFKSYAAGYADTVFKICQVNAAGCRLRLF